MTIFALSDLHLCLGAPEKSMEAFGKKWESYMQKIKTNWEKKITDNDLVLIAGDISWTSKLEDALIDLEWIDRLPGTKLLIKGNHDYWWPSLSKLKAALPPTLNVIQNSAFNWKGASIGGSRLWDTEEFHFQDHIEYQDSPLIKEQKIQKELQEKIYERELSRLKLSLSLLDKDAPLKIAMTHFPPIGPHLKESKASKILQEYAIDIAVFGHLHNIKTKNLFPSTSSIRYLLTSSDYLDYDPLFVASLE